MIALVPVPAINMVLIATSIHACLFDAQTSIIVKHFQTGNLKPASLKVFHSQPTHCRFCGCVSVDTLSIAYSDAEQSDLVICHTLTIDNRAKNSICIRVERDPRETRCLGFEATTERQHWIDRVEGWDTTDMNMIMGVRRKSKRLLLKPLQIPVYPCFRIYQDWLQRKYLGHRPRVLVWELLARYQGAQAQSPALQRDFS